MRVANRIATGLLGLALLIGGVLLVVETALAAAGRQPWLVPRDRWHAALSTTTFANPLVLVICILLALLGLSILVVELRPWPPQRVPVADSWSLTRRSVENCVAAAVSALPGVERVRARVRGRRGRRLRLRTHALPERREAIEQAALAELNAMGVQAKVRVMLQRRLRAR